MVSRHYIISSFLKSLKNNAPWCFERNSVYYEAFDALINDHIDRGMIGIRYDNGDIQVYEKDAGPNDRMIDSWVLVEDSKLVYAYTRFKVRGLGYGSSVFNRLNKHLKLVDCDPFRLLYPTKSGVSWLHNPRIEVQLDIKTG